ncbi:hypothetical protein AJ78_06074 [Emergomyces pasteurianus Ep9510]|uniref:Very-long-chain 3-oxoacyl-CoA synthase n=1 Tax=Emergomyces pasteurianus Ep9510 TaxID=1447872 RepID=A0A1J9QBD9_9EURO|nr:hypothetical protein AJ78_06074 [Emergomyces pasteurianus Ep9510]
MDSIPTLISSSLTLLTLSISIHYHVHVRKNGILPYASTAIKANNYIYTCASLLFFVILVCSLELPLLRVFNVKGDDALHRFGIYLRNQDEQLRYIYHLSKIYEYIDILLVLATGGQIGWHFGFHHLTTPYLSYIRVLHHHAGWRLLASLNTLHHVFMYSYFGGIASFRRLLPFTGFLQLVVGLMGEGVILYNKSNNRKSVGDVAMWPHLVSMALFGTYLVLFAFELMELARKQKKSGRGNGADGVGGTDEKEDEANLLGKELKN